MASLKSIETIVDATVPISDVLDQFRSMGPADNIIIVPHGEDKKKTKYVFHLEGSPSSVVVTEAKVREKEGNKVRSEVSRVSSEKPTDSKRIFCMLPWSDPEYFREERFINHFAKFGPIEYHEVVPNEKGKQWGRRYPGNRRERYG
ncbi:hypothetical protein QAD02_007347 [Eretmocerus hayati]|uniref:Uncharacterized protein n=1 Tax=Eretmocerus hayati TaxID=131215 RepID=A0ACC2N7Q2_9HYME|nr:hypothetical protein QAD02_007347 [Eretmocerus hayati]